MRIPLIVDGEFNGKGIRPEPRSSVDISSLRLPQQFNDQLLQWLREYAALHISNYADQQETQRLDSVGKHLAIELQRIVGDGYQVYYYSDALTTKYVLDHGQFRVVPI